MASISANGSKGHHKFTLTVTETATSTANNTSDISWSFVLSPVAKNYDWSYSSTVPVTYTVTINGTNYTGNIMSYNGTSTVTVRSGTNTITHNNDGSKSISYSFSVSSIDKSYLPGSASASGTMPLTKISRAATITSFVDFNDEGNPVIKYTNPGGYSINARLEFAGTNIHRENISNTGTYTFSLTDAERKLLRQKCTGKSMTVRGVIGTKIGSTSETHWSWLDKTMTIVNDAPTLAPTVVDTLAGSKALTNDQNKMIKYYNSMYATINATAKKEATIVSKKVVNAGVTKTADGSFTNTANNVFEFSATDSRGNTVTKTVTVPMVNYIPLSRNLDGRITLNTADSTKANIEFTVSGNYFNGSFGATSNNLIITYNLKDASGTVIDTQSVTNPSGISNGTYSYTKAIEQDLDYQGSYTLDVWIADKVNPSPTKLTKVFKATPVFDWGKNDFKFNVPVAIEGDLVVNGSILRAGGEESCPSIDYPIEQGIKNGWGYRKWNSGFAECWYSATVTGIDVGEYNLNGFYYCGSKGVNFPFTFTSVEYINATGGSTGNMNIVRPFNNTNTYMTYIVMGLADVSSASVRINLEAKGRWK